MFSDYSASELGWIFRIKLILCFLVNGFGVSDYFWANASNQYGSW